MLFACYVAACITNAVVTIVAFVLYVRYRMANQPEPELKWRSLHFITLALFVFFGVLILVQLSHRFNTPRINY